MKKSLIFLLIIQIGFAQRGNNPFVFTAGYRLPVTKAMIINSGHGLYVEAGINPLWFAKNAGLVIFGGYGMRDNFWNTSFNDGFVNDYRSAINTEKRYSVLDSALINTSPILFATKKGNSRPGCESNSFHNYSLYYGISYRFPGKSNAIIKLYTGTTRSHYRGSNEITANGNNNIQLRRRMYGGEFMLRDPLSLIFKSKTYHCSLVNFGIGVYYEFNDMYTASLFFSDGDQRTNIALRQFTHASFLSKYKREQLFGLKLSYRVL